MNAQRNSFSLGFPTHDMSMAYVNQAASYRSRDEVTGSQNVSPLNGQTSNAYPSTHAPSTQPLPYEYNFFNPQLHYNENAGFTDINGLSEYSYGSYDGNSSPKEIFSNKRELPTRSSNMPKPAQPLKDSEQCIEDNNIEPRFTAARGQSSQRSSRQSGQDSICQLSQPTVPSFGDFDYATGA